MRKVYLSKNGDKIIWNKVCEFGSELKTFNNKKKEIKPKYI